MPTLERVLQGLHESEIRCGIQNKPPPAGGITAWIDFRIGTEKATFYGTIVGDKEVWPAADRIAAWMYKTALCFPDSPMPKATRAKRTTLVEKRARSALGWRARPKRYNRRRESDRQHFASTNSWLSQLLPRQQSGERVDGRIRQAVLRHRRRHCIPIEISQPLPRNQSHPLRLGGKNWETGTWDTPPPCRSVTPRMD
jgi:hypothetical protein